MSIVTISAILRVILFWNLCKTLGWKKEDFKFVCRTSTTYVKLCNYHVRKCHNRKSDSNLNLLKVTIFSEKE